MSDLDAKLRVRLEAVRSNMTAHYAVQQADHGDGQVDAVWNDAGELALAIRDLLDWANGLETDFEGQPSNVGKAFADQVRTVIATSLGVSGEDRSEPTPVPREWRDSAGDLWREYHSTPGDLLVLAEYDGSTTALEWCTPTQRADVERDWGPLTEVLSEVVTPEGTP